MVITSQANEQANQPIPRLNDPGGLSVEIDGQNWLRQISRHAGLRGKPLNQYNLTPRLTLNQQMFDIYRHSK